MTGTRPALLVVALAAALSCAHAFYLPGAAPRNYKAGERVDLFVNALTPTENKESSRLVRVTRLLR
jgi:transmembrane 9 superfamily protein 2/4